MGGVEQGGQGMGEMKGVGEQDVTVVTDAIQRVDLGGNGRKGEATV